MEYCYECIENLSADIIIAAVKDYRRAVKRLAKQPDNERAQSTVRECTRFFRSGWFRFLANGSADLVLGRIAAENG